MLVELSPDVYLTLCGLVSDALQVETDAEHLLKKAENELKGVNAGGMISSELAEAPERIAALRRRGFA